MHYRPLVVVLEDLALVRRGLVLMHGRDYWRIEEAASQARRDAASGPPAVRENLNDPRFFWTEDPIGKVVVIEAKDGDEKPFAVEPGSDVKS